MEDVLVQTWAVSKSIDMEAYGPDPTFTSSYMHDLYLLDPVKSRINYVSLQKNNFENVDSFNNFEPIIRGFFYTIGKFVRRPTL